MHVRQFSLSLIALLAATACLERQPTAVDMESPLLARAPAVSDPTTDYFFPLTATSGFVSDGELASNGYSVYANGVCGVTGKLFATTAASNSGDATLQTDNPVAKQRSCPSYPRKFTVRYASGTVDTRPGFMNLREIQNTTYNIPIGYTHLRILALTLAGSGTGCNALRWALVVQGVSTGADLVNVTRVDASTWSVKSQSATLNKAYCIDNGLTYNIPVDFVVKSSRPMP